MNSVYSKLGIVVAVVLCQLIGVTPGAVAQQGRLDELEDFDYWENLCRLQTDAGKYEEARTACEQAIELEPRDARIWAAHSGILLSLEQYPEAIASAGQSLTFDDQNSLALTYQCIAYTALEQTETALDICNDALRVDGDWGRRSPALAWRYRGSILEQAGQYEQALVAYERTLLLEPDDSLTLGYKCRTQVELERYQQAVRTCQQALEGDGRWQPETAGFAHYYQGVAYTELGENDSAIAALDLALEADPNNAGTWTYQGRVLQNQNQFTEALTSYTRAVELAPTSSRALVGQCSVMNQLQQYETGADACQQAIQGDGEWWSLGAAQAWHQRAHALSGQGMHAEALAAANRAVGMRPGYAEAWSDRSVILWFIASEQVAALDERTARVTYQQAIESAQQALTLVPEAPRTLANLGRYYRSLADLHVQQGRPEPAMAALQDAQDYYQQALSLDSSDDETWVNLSVVLWLQQDYEQALQTASRAVAINPNSVTAWLTQGAALASLGQYQQAQLSYQQALNRNKENAQAWASFAVVSLQLGEFETGMAALQTALQLDPVQPLALETQALVEAQLQAAADAAADAIPLESE